jgi:hypothetical protein
MNAGRNDPCPCGSGKKYKKCCLAVAEADAATARAAAAAAAPPVVVDGGAAADEGATAKQGHGPPRPAAGHQGIGRIQPRKHVMRRKV